jgi:preprotein translocase subunit SecD
VRNRITTFSVTSTDEETQERSTMSVVADGKVRTERQTDPESGLTFVVTTQATCQGNTLVLKNSTSVQNNEMAQLTISITKSGNQLRQVIAGQALGNPINDTVICE